jgi:hypothetical protein
MVNFFHVQPLYSDHLTPSVSQTFHLATTFAKKVAKKIMRPASATRKAESGNPTIEGPGAGIQKTP